MDSLTDTQIDIEMDRQTDGYMDEGTVRQIGKERLLNLSLGDQGVFLDP